MSKVEVSTDALNLPGASGTGSFVIGAVESSPASILESVTALPSLPDSSASSVLVSKFAAPTTMIAVPKPSTSELTLPASYASVASVALVALV